MANVITKDNVELEILPYVAFRIINPITAYYVLGDTIKKAIEEAVVAAFREVIGQNLL